MQYQFDAIAEACDRHRIRVAHRTGDTLKLDLGAGAILVLANGPSECICYFEGNVHDHIHGDYPFTLLDPDGPAFSLNMNPVEVVEALSKGEVLVAEVHRPPYPVERRLMYFRCDDVTQIDQGQELCIRRASLVEPSAGF